MSDLGMTDDELERLRAASDRLMFRDAHLLLWGHLPVGAGGDCEECGQPWWSPEESPDQPPTNPVDAVPHPAGDADNGDVEDGG